MTKDPGVQMMLGAKLAAEYYESCRWAAFSDDELQALRDVFHETAFTGGGIAGEMWEQVQNECARRKESA